MKKALLVIFIFFSICSSSNITMPSNVVHSHVHTNDLGNEHIHEHSHVEVSNTLFFDSFDFRYFENLKSSKVSNKDNLNPKLIIGSIFRPPIV